MYINFYKFFLFFLLLISCSQAQKEEIKNEPMTSTTIYDKNNKTAFLNKVGFDYNTFVSQKEKWNNLKIKNYSYSYISQSFLIYDLKFDVSNDEVVKVTKNNPNSFNKEVTINSLFNEIERTYLNNNSVYYDKTKDFFPTKIEINYDKNYYFPNYLKYTYYVPEFIVLDGNFDWKISSFTPKK